MSGKRKLLFPTDFSESSRAALDHALLWAEVGDAELLLLNVVSFGGADPFDPEHHFPEPEELFERLQVLARSEMARMIESQHGRTLHLREFVRRAPSPASGILAFAREHDVDQIIMGTHGRRGASRLLMGGVTAAVLRGASCPVLVIPSRHPRPAGRLRRILAPVDFSQGSRRSLDLARRMAELTEADLELFHVVPDLEVPLPMNPGGAGLATTVARELVPAAREALADIAAECGPQVRVSTEVWHGPPATTILNRAEEAGADLIVIGTEGRTGFDRLLLGSVADRVSSLSKVPVLVVPSRDRDPQDE